MEKIRTDCGGLHRLATFMELTEENMAHGTSAQQFVSYVVAQVKGMVPCSR